MKSITIFLQSKDAVFYGAMLLIILYVPHAGHLFKELEHVDLTFLGFSFFNWIYGIGLALAIEFLILVFIINGYRATGKFYAVVSFFLNVFYYNYWFNALQSPSAENIRATVLSLFICLTHSLSVWQLSELFYRRIQEERERAAEHWCSQCGAGPFMNKRSLDGHYSKLHKAKGTEPDQNSPQLN
jgi:hypothetical protein